MRNDGMGGAEEELMRRAWLLAAKARGGGTGVGCVMVDNDGKIVGEGFNRLVVPLAAADELTGMEIRRRFVIHAEIIALLSASPGGVTAYCTLAPCFNCLKLLCFSGVRRVIYDHCLGQNKVFSFENARLFSCFLERMAITVSNRHGVPFLDD